MTRPPRYLHGRNLRFPLLSLALLLIASCSRAPEIRRLPPPPRPTAPTLVFDPARPVTTPVKGVPTLFEDQTPERITVVEKMTYGLAVGDVDGDGDLDVYHANFGLIGTGEAQWNELWLNQYDETKPNGKATFKRADDGALPRPAGGPYASRKAEMGDLDGDGDLDIVIANSTIDVQNPGPNQLLINDGRGRFQDRSDLLRGAARGGLTCAVDLVDEDGDGKIDLIFFGNYGPDFIGEANVLVKVIRRPGGRLLLKDVSDRLPDDLLATVDADFGDLDGDGDLDFVTAEVGKDEANRVYLRGEDGIFARGQRLPGTNAATHSVALAKIDDDEHLDVLVGNLGVESTDQLLLGQGNGTFRTGPALPATLGPTTSIGIADVDGKGGLDLWVAKGDGYADRLLLGDGRGGFTDVSQTLGEVFLGSARRGAYRRAGEPTDMPEQAYTHQVVFADLDLDGHPDAVTACGQRDLGETSRIYMNLKSKDGEWGWFPYLKDNKEGLLTRSVVYYGQAVGDLDGDGDLDAVAAGRGSRLLINQGGFLEDVIQPSGRQTHVFRDEACHRASGGSDIVGEALRLGDVDRDGDLDLVEVAWSFGGRFFDRIHLNCGDGRFGRADADRLPDPRRDHIADNLILFDADSKNGLDILTNAIYRDFAANPSEGAINRLLLNDGRGDFRDATTRLPRETDTDGTFAAAAADLDGDGDQDLVYANGYDLNRPNPNPNGMKNRVLINQGGDQAGVEGVFLTLQNAFSPNFDEHTEDVALADFDGDGRPDLALANNGPSAVPRILFNDGSGRFREISGRMPPLERGWRLSEVEVGDLDLDRDLDVIFLSRHGELDRSRMTYEPARPLLILRNDGQGKFERWLGAAPETPSYAGDAELIDVDGDGDLDLYVGAWDWKVSRIFVNGTVGGFRKPQLTELQPSFANADRPLVVVFRGRFLRPDLEVRMRDPLGNMSKGGVHWVSPAEVWVRVPEGLKPGSYRFFLRDRAGKKTQMKRLEILAAGDSQIEIQHARPAELARGSITRVLVRGKNFPRNVDVALTGPGLRLLEVERRNKRRLDLTIYVAPGTTGSAERDLVIRDSQGRKVVTASGLFKLIDSSE